MVLDKCDARGFNVTIIYGHNGFNKAQLKEYFLPIWCKYMEMMNVWTLLKESSESRKTDVGALHTPYHTYIIPY